MSLDTIAPVHVLRIQEKLAAAELDHRVDILFAIESGSRAWGFPSPDSDFDVRFVYVRKEPEYLRFLSKPAEDNLDLNRAPGAEKLFDVVGWDLQKALRLMLGSNASLLEWVQSPIVYRAPEANYGVTYMTHIDRLARRLATRRNLTGNYLGLANRFQQDFICTGEGHNKSTALSDKINLKKYFYGLRPALTLRCLRLRPLEVPPMHIDLLLLYAQLPAETEALIRGLIEKKAYTREMGDGARIPALEALILEEIEQARPFMKEARSEVPDSETIELCEDFFHRAITRRL